jgi:hypothetical protein
LPNGFVNGTPVKLERRHPVSLYAADRRIRRFRVRKFEPGYSLTLYIKN